MQDLVPGQTAPREGHGRRYKAPRRHCCYAAGLRKCGMIRQCGKVNFRITGTQSSKSHEEKHCCCVTDDFIHPKKLTVTVMIKDSVSVSVSVSVRLQPLCCGTDSVMDELWH
jgi:hypothetical protein